MSSTSSKVKGGATVSTFAPADLKSSAVSLINLFISSSTSADFSSGQTATLSLVISVTLGFGNLILQAISS